MLLSAEPGAPLEPLVPVLGGAGVTGAVAGAAATAVETAGFGLGLSFSAGTA